MFLICYTLLDMSKERKSGSYRRIDYILGLVKQGLSPEEIDQRLQALDSRRERRLTTLAKGSDNEVRVARLLQGAPYVQSIERTRTESPEDKAGYDMFVYLRGIDPLDVVGVQVKSSQKGIDKFLRERGAKGFRQSLIDRRLVMINGSLTDVEITESFVAQVQRIAHRARLEQSQQAKRNSM